MQLTFCGGTKSVTGANYLLEAGGVKILVDCGLFQGTRFSEEQNYAAFAYDATTIDYALITHSHIDHIGRLPKLYRDGFRGTIFTTEPTKGIMEVALPDAMDKMLQEARDMGHEPLYSQEDFHESMALVRGVHYNTPIALGEQVHVIFHDASHILGSAIIEFIVNDDGQEKKLVFTGDLGNPPTPLLHPIDYVSGADYGVIESAYGNRLHEDREERLNKLENAIEGTIKDGGVLMIPSFAVERTQELLLEIDKLIKADRIPNIPVFVDSPLAIKITKVYSQYSHYFNKAAMHVLEASGGLFQFPWLTFTPTVEKSKKINDTPSPKIIIAGSGMSQGGRILHHESRYLPDPKSTILFIGYQVAGSLGRKIFEGAQEVSIFGQSVPVRCRVKAIGSYSAHADQNGLLEFVTHAKEGGRLKQVFVVQGEAESAEALAVKVKENLGVDAVVPDANYTVSL